MDQELLQKALNLSYFYLKFRPRTEKEMRDYLHKKAPKFNFSEEIIDAAIEELTEMRFVNDVQFVEWYVNAKQQSKPRSSYLLKQELMRKGVPREIIDTFFMEFEMDESKASEQALERKWRSYRNLEPEKRYQRAIQFLMRKGFSYDNAKKAVARREKER